MGRTCNMSSNKGYEFEIGSKLEKILNCVTLSEAHLLEEKWLITEGANHNLLP